ncbi:trypsin-like serine protease, typically periplasmic, contain C-terminal PDZ domain [Microbacterium testaceum StLB037]|uniref:Trypsin-like serine protease, typically periplasmic, contain C-terminal PDZ domain n=1 Tax=Microbacterium testaceum (strain StLB037) TaxID=979556 RepID=E8NBH0_MICTS|nr:MarP family serine protease [Microbacterium testaceum]BAJ76027.1 trypsin-like serine protease, typically periplasmic, contain C-terminal PDZ domain [Microbacterium testaceum StLB037]
MAVVDIVLIVVLAVALLVGLSRGFLATIGFFAGLALGAVAAFWATPFVGQWVAEPDWRGPAMVGAGVLLLLLGAGLGSTVGQIFRRGADRIKLRIPERLLGGVVNVAAAALAISFVSGSLIPAGMPVVSAALGSSAVVRTIDDITPSPLRAAIAQLRGTVLADGIPRLGQLIQIGPVPTAPDIALDDPALTEAAQSVARISGTAYACGITSSGSGFVAADGRVITNAHVVAGVDAPLVELPGQPAREGRVVYFDPSDDLAVVAVDGLDATPLPVVSTLEVGAAAVVQGYPYGGPFTSGSAQVLSVGSVPVPDIYDGQSSPREIYALAATVRPGNSGGPLLTPSGDVAGVVFARSDTDDNVGYAMTPAELEPVMAQLGSLSTPVASGACTPR